jgi:hypothetical protein
MTDNMCNSVAIIHFSFYNCNIVAFIMMNLLHLFSAVSAPPHVLKTADIAELRLITKRQYNLAIYSRSVDEQLEGAVQALLQSSFKGIDKVMEQNEDWHESIALAIGLGSSTNWIALEPLVNDIANCCKLFSGITHSRTLRLSLKTVTTDACRKFHVDGYTYRLLCSYHGPGTEWMYNENVNRKALGVGENEAIVKDWSSIQRMHTFDIAILKGELPYQRNGKGIVHRSPPVEHTNDKRLVLRIDYTS